MRILVPASVRVINLPHVIRGLMIIRLSEYNPCNRCRPRSATEAWKFLLDLQGCLVPFE